MQHAAVSGSAVRNRHGLPHTADNTARLPERCFGPAAGFPDRPEQGVGIAESHRGSGLPCSVLGMLTVYRKLRALMSVYA
jgi:hypothetical protein